MQILLDAVCLGLSAAVGVDTLLGRALIAVSVVNILLTVLMLGEYGRRRYFACRQLLAVLARLSDRIPSS